ARLRLRAGRERQLGLRTLLCPVLACSLGRLGASRHALPRPRVREARQADADPAAGGSGGADADQADPHGREVRRTAPALGRLRDDREAVLPVARATRLPTRAAPLASAGCAGPPCEPGCEPSEAAAS